MARRRPRGLRPEEEELWQRVARSLTPLHSAPPRPLADAPPPRPVRHDPAGAEPLPDFHIGQSARPATHAPAPAEPRIRMDRKAYLRLARGKLAPEARLDLHGRTLAEAHPELIRFVLSAHTAGKRLVLVITGKGRDSDSLMPVRRGILRHQVPHWLGAPPLGAVVMQVTQAHRKHGGDGALYVYLRR